MFSSFAKMESIERGLLAEEKNTSHWWRRLKWGKILFYTGIVLFLYDFTYCMIIYFYIKALNTSPDFRLVVYKSHNRFMKLYYTLHYYFGDPSLHDEDTSRWHQLGDL